MKTGADLEQACDAAPQQNSPLGRLRDAAQDLEQRALAGTVAADDADDLALLDLEADILERPEFLDLVALNDLSPANTVDRLARKIASLATDDVAQRCIAGAALAADCMANQVSLRQIFDGDDGIRHGDAFSLRSGRQSFFPSF